MDESKGIFRINEVFDSINGEVAGGGQGSVCRFIRFAGCNLQCHYCDTQHEDANILYTMEDLIKCIEEGPKNVTFTGGEPLLQLTKDKMHFLLDSLDSETVFNIETNGTIKPDWHNAGLIYTMDYKMPSSGMNEDMKLSNFIDLTRRDFIKFVCESEREVGNALEVAEEMRKLKIKAKFAISPMFAKPIKGKAVDHTHIRNLADRVMKDRFAKEDGVIFSLQLHKILGVR